MGPLAWGARISGRIWQRGEATFIGITATPTFCDGFGDLAFTPVSFVLVCMRGGVRVICLVACPALGFCSGLFFAK